MNRLAAPLLIAASLACSGPVRAQGLDFSKGGAIDVTARDGIEWRQNEQEVIAHGDARAIRGNATVMADTLIAHYRKKAGTPSATGSPAATPASATAPSTAPNTADTGNNEIYRLEADGNVKIFTPTDIAVGDHAIYDIDQAVLLLTGKNMTLTTPTDLFTARDTMEWWSQKHMAVGRGLATVTTSDGRYLAGDVLVGYTAPPGATPPGAPSPAPAAPKPASTSADPLMGASGKLQRVEAFGHVEVRTATETIKGERAVYVADTGMSRIAGDVRITRGQNQANGDEALVNMNTGISTLIRNPGKRVEGLVVPNDTSTKDIGAKGTGAKDQPPAPKK